MQVLAYGSSYAFNTKVADSNHRSEFSSQVDLKRPMWQFDVRHRDSIMTRRLVKDCQVTTIVLVHLALPRLHG